MKKYKAIKDRISTIESPIVLMKGETVELLEMSNPDGDWPNWALCKKEEMIGWVPQQIIDDNGIILENYNATEFDLTSGDIINGLKELNGWVWGYKKNQEAHNAWAPLNYLEEII